MKTTHRLLVLALGFAVQNASTAMAQTQDFTYATYNGTITITGYTGPGGAVTIPGRINNLPVTGIGSFAFASPPTTNLFSVIIPDSVISIAGYAFASLTADLRGLYFLGNAPFVGTNAFMGDNYATVYYLAGTTGWGATLGGLPAVGWDPQMPYTYAIAGGKITITKYIGPGGAVDVPNTIGNLPVASIGDSAFSRCIGLTSIKLPGSLTSIGKSAFDTCPGLTNVTIGDNVATIGDSAFAGCTSLASITIPNSVTTIANGAFGGCASLTSVIIPRSVTSIGRGAFTRCDRLEAITVDTLNPNYRSVDGVLFNKSQAALVEFPGGKSGSYAIPQGVVGIEAYAFTFCRALSNISIPNSVTNIGDYAFHNCTGLASVAIANGLTSIGVYAFGYCSSLTDVTIPNSVTNIGSSAFGDCTSLTRITIPDSTTSIADATFYDCTSLAEVKIPNSITSIGANAFYNCNGLTRVTIGSNVTNIGNYAFSFCRGPTQLFFEGNAASIGQDVFYESGNATVYYLPGSIGWGTTYGGLPTAPWFLPHPFVLTIAPNFGVQNNLFGFRISWATNASVVVEASTTLANPTWLPVSTNNLIDGWSYFSDPDYVSRPCRWYRIRSP